MELNRVGMTPDESYVLWVLENSACKISGQRLALQACLKNTAQLRIIIHSLRIRGAHICSDPRGYWIAHNDEELMESSQQMEQLAFSILRAARGMRGSLVGQIELERNLND